jgi:hypothetical protein
MADFFWPLERQRATLLFPTLAKEVACFSTSSKEGTAIDFLLGNPISTPLAFAGAMTDSTTIFEGVVADDKS